MTARAYCKDIIVNLPRDTGQLLVMVAGLVWLIVEIVLPVAMAVGVFWVTGRIARLW